MYFRNSDFMCYYCLTLVRVWIFKIFSQKKNTPANFSEETGSSVIKFSWKQFCGKTQRKKHQKKIGVIRWVSMWLETGKSITALGCLHTFLLVPSCPKLFLKIPVWSLCNHYTVLRVTTIALFFQENSEYLLSLRSECNVDIILKVWKSTFCPRNTFQALQTISSSDVWTEAAAWLWRALCIVFIPGHKSHHSSGNLTGKEPSSEILTRYLIFVWATSWELNTIHKKKIISIWANASGQRCPAAVG